MTRTDKGGNTPFHLCCKNGHAAVVRKFLAILEEDGVLEQANRSVTTVINDNDRYCETQFAMLTICNCIMIVKYVTMHP